MKNFGDLLFFITKGKFENFVKLYRLIYVYLIYIKLSLIIAFVFSFGLTFFEKKALWMYFLVFVSVFIVFFCSMYFFVIKIRRKKQKNQYDEEMTIDWLKKLAKIYNSSGDKYDNLIERAENHRSYKKIGDVLSPEKRASIRLD